MKWQAVLITLLCLIAIMCATFYWISSNSQKDETTIITDPEDALLHRREYKLERNETNDILPVRITNTEEQTSEFTLSCEQKSGDATVAFSDSKTIILNPQERAIIEMQFTTNNLTIEDILISTCKLETEAKLIDEDELTITRWS